MSLPARGAWVEICIYGKRWTPDGSRSPHGERGLKYASELTGIPRVKSLPARGAWVEMRTACWSWRGPRVAPRTGSVG